MAAAVYDTAAVTVEGRTTDHPDVGSVFELAARGRVLRFDGYLRLYEESDGDDEADGEGDDGGLLPAMEVGEAQAIVEVDTKKSTTKPPPRYTEASFVKTLERVGVGRPSTYVQTVAVLFKRGYIQAVRKKLVPTDLGVLCVEILEQNFPEVCDVGFTAQMEADLDAVASGETDWEPYIVDWWTDFSTQLKEKKGSVDASQFRQTIDRPCPRCGSELVVRFSSRGKFIACTAYPECRYAVDASGERTAEDCPECGEGKLMVRVGKNRRKWLVCERRPACEYIRGAADKLTGEACPKCEKGRLTRKKGKFGPYVSCDRWFAGCDYRPPKEVEATEEDCPKCGEAQLVKRKSKSGGEFLACPRYPDCDYIRDAAAKVLDEPCPQCGEGTLIEKKSKKGNTFVGCDRYPSCDYIRRDPVTSTDVTCPSCGEGSLLVRKGKKGVFFGCERYPACDYLTNTDPRTRDV